MPSGGHNRKSREQHIIEGTFRKHRHSGTAEPMADGKPETPRGLDASGKWMFKFIAKAKWIKNVDSAEVKAICQLWSSYMKYHKLAKRNPDFHKQEYDALDRWHKLSCRLGLNPVSRAQIKLDGEKAEQDEFAKFLSESG